MGPEQVSLLSIRAQVLMLWKLAWLPPKLALQERGTTGGKGAERKSPKLGGRTSVLRSRQDMYVFDKDATLCQGQGEPGGGPGVGYSFLKSAKGRRESLFCTGTC